MKYDIELHRQFKDIAIIDYGIIKGNNNILFVKAGQDGSMYGYKNKYLKIAKMINKKYGSTVICSSNPFDGNNPLDNAFTVIEKYTSKFEDYKVYYLGFSNGALIGAYFGINYPKIKRMLLVNMPLIYDINLIKNNLNNFNNEKVTIVYGSLDYSINLLENIKNIKSNRVDIKVILNEDHYFSKDEEDFYSLPEKYLFYKE